MLQNIDGLNAIGCDRKIDQNPAVFESSSLTGFTRVIFDEQNFHRPLHFHDSCTKQSISIDL